MSREKYEKAKSAARTWHSLLLEKEKENKLLKEEVARWKKFSENLPDMDTDLELEIQNLRQTIKVTENDYKDKIVKLEREKILLEGKVQQLEESKKDLYERYQDLKQDLKEMKKG